MTNYFFSDWDTVSNERLTYHFHRPFHRLAFIQPMFSPIIVKCTYRGIQLIHAHAYGIALSLTSRCVARQGKRSDFK